MNHELEGLATLADALASIGLSSEHVVRSHIHGQTTGVNTAAYRAPLVYPGNGKRFGWLQEADAMEVDQAVCAAREAFEHGPWPRIAVEERQRILRRAGELIDAQRSELAIRESLCAGLTIAHLGMRQIPRAAQNYRFFADVIGTLGGDTFEQEKGFLTVITRQPSGVAALLAPWNAPLALASMQIASCIAFGNCCVMKPSEYTPLSILAMVGLLEEAGVPPGVVNVVNGRGGVTGRELVSHRQIDRIAFTGGTATAREVMAAAAANLTPVHFELGGKSANIVFDDADYDRAMDGSLLNIFANNGQICLAGSRILVQRPIAQRFIDEFAARTGNLKIGNPMHASTEIGPMAFEKHRDRVLSYSAMARREGAEILTGGGRPKGFDNGWYIEPTAALVNSNTLRVCQEEIFGPFATLQVFDELEEAIHIANDSEFGLVSYGWTENLNTALKLQDSIHAGTIWLNTPLLRDLRAPFGGFKNSGIGREGPKQCADFYSEEKAAIFARGKAPIRALGARR